MLKVTYDDEGIGIFYDGSEFCLNIIDPTCVFVMVKRWDGWHYFGSGTYDSIADACAEIFWDVDLDRYESGRFIWDGDNIVASVPLTYYSRPAFKPVFDDSYDAEDLMFCL